MMILPTELNFLSEVIFMIAEMMVSQNERLNIKIVGASEKTIMIDLPAEFNKFLLYNPNEVYELSYYYNELLFILKIHFSRLYKRNSQTLFEFNVLHNSVYKNYRKDMRYFISKPVTIYLKNSIEEVITSDISQSGLRVQSLNPLTDKFFDFEVSTNNFKKTAKGQIAWAKKDKGYYYYGIEAKA